VSKGGIKRGGVQLPRRVRSNALDHLAVGVEKLDGRTAVGIDSQRQAVPPLPVGEQHAGDAVGRLADEHALSGLRRAGAHARDRRITRGGILDRARAVQLVDQIGERRVRPIPHLEPGAPLSVPFRVLEPDRLVLSELIEHQAGVRIAPAR